MATGFSIFTTIARRRVRAATVFTASARPKIRNRKFTRSAFRKGVAPVTRIPQQWRASRARMVRPYRRCSSPNSNT